ncbi:MAG: hypothetical protein HQL90_06520 [Magnetococcales bacterium]|nr:hypothetical protein [Magnetococcales bacterium]
MVTIWQALWLDHPTFQNEERPLRAQWEDTKGRITALAKEIYDNQNSAPCPRPVELAALDKALYQEHMTNPGGDRICSDVTVNGQKFHVYLRSFPRPFSLHDTQSGHLAFWLRHYRIVPASIRGYSVDIKFLDSTSNKKLRGEGKIARVYLGTFPDGCTPDWSEKHKPYYVADKITNPDRRLGSILQALEEAEQQGAQVVLFPELTVTVAHRQEICRWLNGREHPFLLVVPGSFHKGALPGEKAQSSCNDRRNQSCILNSAGVPLLEQDKLVPLFVRNRLEGNNSSSTEDKRCFEGVGSAEKIHLLDTDIGLIALAICRDLLQESSPITDIWESLAPDWILVPSMSEGVSGHQLTAERLFRMYGTRVLVANQCLAGKFEKASHGFVSPLRIPLGEILPIAPHNRLANVSIPG